MKNNLLVFIISIASIFIIFSLFLIILGKDITAVYSVLFSEVFGSSYGLGQTFFKTTTYIFLGCALALSFQAGLFNIGAEGQLNAAAFSIAIISLFPIQGFILLPISIILSFFCTGLLGLLAAYLKINRNINEVVSTIMMNFIVIGLVNWLVVDFFGVSSTMHTPKINESLIIQPLSAFLPYFEGSYVNILFVVSIVFAFICFVFLYKTSLGYKIRAIGLNYNASKHMQIPVKKYSYLILMFSAGLTVLAALNIVNGYKGYYEFGSTNNAGFTAIAAALLARNNPVLIILTSFLFAMLEYGGLAVNSLVPKEIMLIFQGLVILVILVIDKKIKFKSA